VARVSQGWPIVSTIRSRSDRASGSLLDAGFECLVTGVHVEIVAERLDERREQGLPVLRQGRSGSTILFAPIADDNRSDLPFVRRQLATAFPTDG
jgi:hypothetical protein